MRIYEHLVKRILDICFSLTALILFSPILLVVAVVVRVKLGAPVIFKQQRPGKDEKIFTLYKFRTMTDAKSEEGNYLTDTERVTKLGRFLRFSSLDELPELFNILKGDMAIIGPRPLLVQYLPYYTDKEKHRHDVRPGLTGLAQLHGRNSSPWEERFKYDLQYVYNITFMNDIKILFLTVKRVLKKEGIVLHEANTVKALNVERSNSIND